MKAKIIIDAGMIILVLMQMAYHLIGDSLHGWIGMILFVLIALHNILDRKWYLGLCKGKYTSVRFFHTAINLLLLASFIGLAISTAFLSTTLSTFFHLKAAMIGRRMHMFFTTWSYVLMSIHVGLHWNMIICAVKKRMNDPKHLYKATARIAVTLVAAYGLYVFISRELPQRMFLLSEYVFFDYDELILFCLIDYTSVLCLFACLTYYINAFFRKKRKCFSLDKIS